MTVGNLVDSLVGLAIYVFAILAAYYLVSTVQLERLSHAPTPAVRFLLFLALVPLLASPLGAVWSRLSSLVEGYSVPGRAVAQLVNVVEGLVIALLLLLALWAFQGRGTALWAALYQPIERLFRSSPQS